MKILLCNLLLLNILIMANGCKKKDTQSKEAKLNSQALAAHWSAGQRYSFDIQMNSETSLTTQQMLSQLSFAGTLLVSALSKEGDDQLLHIQLENIALEITDPSEENSKTKELTHQLGLPVWARWQGGLLKGAFFPPDSSVFAVGIWRALLSQLQIKKGSAENGVLLSGEYDANGEYLAQYELVDSKTTGENHWKKTKKKYIKGMFSDQAEVHAMGAPTPVLMSSESSIFLRDTTLVAISSEEEISYSLSGPGGLKGNTRFKLTHKSKKKLTTPVKEPSLDMLYLASKEPFSQKMPIDAMDHARIGDFTFEEVVKALAHMARDSRRNHLVASENQQIIDAQDQQKGSAWMQEWSRYFSALPAFFRQQPVTIEQAVNLIAEESAASRSLLGGLSGAGTPLAQEALQKIIENTKIQTQLREMALRSLIQCTEPSKVAIDFVQSLYEHPEYSRYAPFALGTVARKLRSSGQNEEAEQLVSVLTEKLKTASDRNEVLDTLMGVANSGHPLALSAVIPFLKSEDEAKRAGALEALRLIPHERVDEILLQHLDSKKETSARVRNAAVSSVSMRSVSKPYIEALSRLASSDDDQKVRKKARGVLFNWLDKDSSIRDILNKIAEQTPAQG